MSNHLEVAKIILDQFGGNLAMRMIGGYNVFCHDEPCSALSFRFKAKAKDGQNYCKIVLNGLDLYNVEIGRIYGSTYIVKSTHENIYSDMLQDVFETDTGLFLTFHAR